MRVMMKWASLKKKKQQQEETAKETQTWQRLRNLFSTSSSSAKWKRVEIIMVTEIVDGVVYKVMYVVEALVLVSTLCFFYLCCGCHI
ncbi:unnamed protein product [Arabidopsis lyrata]|uniref:Transmembrane protein n=1 Tax=Arabidopsis lyrata subsp. lyrata TaxID=81972 RepID=D7KG39_ARALL|nr:uncharacterized protein LOC9325670 [Arabidopsis lyrata subsp. lyrata]EFH68603.1 hypothetical protein ARALYDRAFT_470668 [Arabidopsis lyrata subsp. lyrata]CAH8251368.1 unnamed protein product [Arabidopsis lyrata]|eukprot:XP_020869000.1 uncharacterized protein LOC9325670 [Arabidopsis lyrata subsp. lyrata]